MSATVAAVTKFEPHPLAELMPGMSKTEYESLRNDIATKGFLEDFPIVLFEGKILDGRHRARACAELGIEPKTKEYDGDTPAAFVVSANLERRNLSVSQLAALGVEFLPPLEQEGKARQVELGRERGGRPDPRAQKSSRVNGGDSEPPLTRARERVGALLGISHASIGRAKRIKKEDSALFERVKAGKMTVGAAGKKLGHPAAKPKQVPDLPNLDNEYGRRRARATHKRLTKSMSFMDGFATALRDEDVYRACLVASTDETGNWNEIANRTVKALKSLQAALETMRGADAHSNNGDS